jgi:thiol-disulfide isomerase/thioredoxin
VRPFPPLADELQLLEEILPSWLGVRYRRVPSVLSAGRELPEGATWIQAVFPDSPALEAGLEVGDIVLGPPARPFTAEGQLREWTMTSSRATPLALRVLRPAERAEDDQELDVTLSLRPYPVVWPELPGPLQVGDAAPALPSGLKPVGSAELPDLQGRSRIVLFWATWCRPCRRAVPELLAFAEAEGLPVLAITDEESETVAGYLSTRKEAFFEHVLLDPLRASFRSYGVSGTPTIMVIDEDGVVRHRQVGYNKTKGLTIEGWQWSQP